MSELIDTNYNNIIQCTLLLVANIYIVYNLMYTTLEDIDQTMFPDDKDEKQEENDDNKEDNTDDNKEDNTDDKQEENQTVPYPIAVPFTSHMSQLAVFLLCLLVMFLLIDIVIDILSFEKHEKKKSVYDLTMFLKTFIPLFLSAIVCYQFNKIYAKVFVDKEELNNKSYVKLQIICLFIANIIIVSGIFVFFQIKTVDVLKYHEHYFKFSESGFIIWLKKKFSKK